MANTGNVFKVRDRGKLYDVADMEARSGIEVLTNAVSEISSDMIDESDLPIMTLAEWEALGPEKYTDDKIYFIKMNGE